METHLRKETEHTRGAILSVRRADRESKAVSDGRTEAKIVIAAFHASECRSISRSSAAGGVAAADSATLKAEMYSFCDLSNIQSASINETFGKCTKTTLQNLYTK